MGQDLGSTHLLIKAYLHPREDGATNDVRIVENIRVVNDYPVLCICHLQLYHVCTI